MLVGLRIKNFKSIREAHIRFGAFTCLIGHNGVGKSNLFDAIHPSRIPNLVQLLRDYAVDVDEPVTSDNPLRQVLVNTHSPEVVRRVPLEEMVFVESASSTKDGQYSIFRPISDTWRAKILDEPDSAVLPKDPQRVADFIGGSGLLEELKSVQLKFDFGSAR